ISPTSVQFTNTYSVTGTVDENGNASLDITQVTTTAPSTITVTATFQTDHGLVTELIPIPVSSMTQTDFSRNYAVLLQNGYQETIPFSGGGTQGQTVITVSGGTAQYTLTIQPSTNGSTSPAGTITKNAGTTLTVTATPNKGYTFDHWLLDRADAGNSNPFTVTFDSDHTLQPVFTQVHLTFNIYKAGVIGDAAGILRMYNGTTLVGSWRAGSGDNDPSHQNLKYPDNEQGGPLPSGIWWVNSPGVNSNHPSWFYLDPASTTNTRGRDTSVSAGFYIHGGSVTQGCIAVASGQFPSFEDAMKKYNPSGGSIQLAVSYFYYWYLKSVRITAHSPVNILVTSLDGSRVGYDWTANTTVNEIDGSTYTGPGTEPQVISIPSLFPDTYTVNAYGTGTGSYTITVDSIAENDSTTSTTTWTGTTSPGRLDENTVQVQMSTPPSNRTAGVNQGDWAQYSVSWQAGAPSSFSDVTGIRVTVVEISGTTLTISATMQFKNGTTTPSGPSTLDVNTGQGSTTAGLNMEVIASGLNLGDLVFTSQQSSLPNAQIADVTPWTRDGFNRTAVHLISNTLGEYYWDRDTGILLYAEVPVYSGNSTTPAATATLTLAGTNRFNGGSTPSSLPIFLLMSVAGAAAVVIVLIAVAVALRRHRRKTRTSPPEETVEPKATPVNPPEAADPRTPTGKKFVFCPECGEKLPDLNAKFCPFCGARLELQPGTNAKTDRAEPLKEAASEGGEGATTKAYKKHEPLKNAAKVAKHGWKFKIAVTLLIIIIATNTVYYFDVFKIDPALQPAQQIMDQIWSAPVLSQVHQAISQIVQGILYQLDMFRFGLSPARDLTGRWVSMVQREGLVVTPLNGPHRFHYDITMDIVQSGSTFTGTMYITLWKAEALVPYSIWVDDGYWNFSPPGPVQTEEVTNGVISGVNIQFQVIGWTWKGTFTTDNMKGTVQGYDSGVYYSGTFTLRRE
ncbi:zinc-ribbon domain-containing protein, partial [Candidatus Bathyarchaeota archaeon]|nr:zinc-ribbon domain-containing protein [Candidatus Bathyarchaeota archaeon]